MNLEELLHTIRTLGPAGFDVEVRGGVGKRALESLSALANSGGGMLIIGLSSKTGYAPISGFNARRARDKLLVKCQQLTPAITPDVLSIPVDGTDILVARIPEVRPRNKPCYITKLGVDGGSFRRSEDRNTPLDPTTINHLLAEQNQPTWDKTPIPGARLNPQLTQHYLKRQDKLGLPATALIDAHPTLAAVLAWGNHPHLGVSFAVFPGVQRQLPSSMEKFTGPVPELVAQVLEHTLGFYPEEAVREALVNALIHRDYSPARLGENVRVEMFADRLEIHNPGGLYGGVTRADLGELGLVGARNAHLAQLVEFAPLASGDGVLAQNRGSGISAIRRALADAGHPPAEIAAGLLDFCITFRPAVRNAGHGTATAHDEIAAELAARGESGAADLAQATGLSRSAVQKALNQLIADGLVEATGPKRSPKQKYRWVAGGAQEICNPTA